MVKETMIIIRVKVKKKEEKEVEVMKEDTETMIENEVKRNIGEVEVAVRIIFQRKERGIKRK